MSLQNGEGGCAKTGEIGCGKFNSSSQILENLQSGLRMLGPYTTHATPILLLCAPYKPTTIIVVPLH